MIPEILLMVLLCSATISSHMIMAFPPSRGYTKNDLYKPVDYDLMAPLKEMVMCKGKPPGSPVASFNPGDTVNVSFTGSARHHGGLCQFALSYDHDIHFYLIAEYRYGCPDSSYTWPVKIPDDAPPCSKCTFSWAWVNAVGNREYYMDCADITINGPTQPASSCGPSCGKFLQVYNFPGFGTLQPQEGYGGPSASKYIPFDFSCSNSTVQ
ncbi:hypothetical protein MDAP_001797 [Mitosporidium daphniae]|uniref:Chitin-binding type-4 domain-containing protein n=1 Tax=Mitosporidium daphniae TaxID=1485682 RepID=A0A098VWT5_9MICR|nr:uncharacterized protein DI09_19p80 [Mitosporidium daphniae]KGG52226.1 hypothetical protein DI09_19p80 [Mitosporidium daphniae]|eukprot:XP_013238691.1 uncharacterized protein DI09_19p80 [Mitosporidium daphniae]